MPKTRLAVKQYDGGGTTGYALFKASTVRNVGDMVTWDAGIDPYRGYYGLTKAEANMYKEQLEKV